MNYLRVAHPYILAAALLAGGCTSHSNQQAASQAPKPAAVAAAPAPSAATVVPVFPADEMAKQNTSPMPDALAQKTTEYARTMEPAVNARGAAPPTASQVQWADAPPRAHAAANTPAAIPAGNPPPSNAMATAADKAQVAAVTSSAQNNAMNDVPAIVPESSDFASPHAAGESLETKLSKQVHDNPRDVAAELDYELYGLLKDESSPQLASLSVLPNEDREVVAALVDGVSNFRAAVRQDNNMLLSKKIQPILDMADRLRTQAELSVPTVVLCKSVNGFGNYDPIDPPSFPAGQQNPMIVYCEVANFASQLDDRQYWQTRLRQEVTLYTDTGLPVWHEKSRDVIDECRNRRHDFFIYDVVKLPANLSVGRYILKITVQDLTANRVREATVPLEMIAG